MLDDTDGIFCDNNGYPDDKDIYQLPLAQDFDRGMVPMVCDQREKGCTYELPHYHCQICHKQVNSDELRRDYHHCCSVECVGIWNQKNYSIVS